MDYFKAFRDLPENRKFFVDAYIEQLKKLEPLTSLPACVKDAKKWIKMLYKDHSIRPADLFLLASQQNYD